MPADGHHHKRPMHIPFLLFLQAVLIVLFGFFVEYDSPAAPAVSKSSAQHHGLTKSSVNGNDTGNSIVGNGPSPSVAVHGSHHADDDVNTLGHYYPSKLVKF